MHLDQQQPIHDELVVIQDGLMVGQVLISSRSQTLKEPLRIFSKDIFHSDGHESTQEFLFQELPSLVIDKEAKQHDTQERLAASSSLKVDGINISNEQLDSVQCLLPKMRNVSLRGDGTLEN